MNDERPTPPSEAALEAARRIHAQNQLTETYTRLAAHGDRERNSFKPSRQMERLALQILGCWQNLTGEVSWTRFEFAGIDGEWDRGAGVPSELNRIATRIGIRWPHDEIAAAIDQASKVRHKIAHMLYIVSIDGTSPNQTMTIARLGTGPGQRRAKNGAPAELAWRDEHWSEQKRHHETITEAQMREALEGIEWVWRATGSLVRARQLIAMTTHLPDSHEIDLENWGLRFPQRSWFADPDHPTLGELRAKPSSAAAADNEH